MKNKTFTWTYHEEKQQKQSLDVFLRDNILADGKVDVSRSRLKKLLEDKTIAVQVDGRPIHKASYKLSGKLTIKLIISVKLLKELSDKVAIKDQYTLTEQCILWEDRWLLVAVKPKGLPSLQTLDPSRDYFLAAVKRLLTERDGREPYLSLLHRLDVETSGVMLFCKKKSMNKKVGDLFAQRKIEKTYHALCTYQDQDQDQPLPPRQWEYKNYLKKKPSRPLKMIAVKSGGDFAHTSFRLLDDQPQENGTVLIEAKPHTGRTHQIRVHLAQQGYPIVNDSLYGQVIDNSMLKLHAVSLQFIHPETQEEILVKHDDDHG